MVESGGLVCPDAVVTKMRRRGKATRSTGKKKKSKRNNTGLLYFLERRETQ